MLLAWTSRPLRPREPASREIAFRDLLERGAGDYDSDELSISVLYFPLGCWCAADRSQWRNGYLRLVVDRAVLIEPVDVARCIENCVP